MYGSDMGLFDIKRLLRQQSLATTQQTNPWLIDSSLRKPAWISITLSRT